MRCGTCSCNLVINRAVDSSAGERREDALSARRMSGMHRSALSSSETLRSCRRSRKVADYSTVEGKAVVSPADAPSAGKHPCWLSDICSSQQCCGHRPSRMASSVAAAGTAVAAHWRCRSSLGKHQCWWSAPSSRERQGSACHHAASMGPGWSVACTSAFAARHGLQNSTCW